MTGSLSPSVKFLHLNINSILSKLSLLLNLIAIHSPDIISLNETKLNINSHLNIPGYQIFRKDVSRSKGGVLIAVKNILKTTLLSNPTQPNNQSIEIIIERNNRPLHIISYYSPPREPISPAIIQKCSNKNTILLGDLNAHNIIFGSSKTSEKGKALLEICDIHNLTIINQNTKTRLNPINNNTELLDYAITSNDLATKTHSVQILEDDLISDHFPLLFELEIT